MADGAVAAGWSSPAEQHLPVLGDKAALLQAWMSPAFPVGAFAYSHGLEWAASAGLVRDRVSVEAWLRDLISHGGLRSDLVLLTSVWRAATRGDVIELRDVAELAAALQPTAERRLEAITQGGAFMTLIRAVWPCAAVEMLDQAWTGDVTYPVAVGTAAAGHAVPLRPTLAAYGLAFVSNLVSASIRLSVIGQTDGQRVIASLMPLLQDSARELERASLDDLGTATWAGDLCSLQHETQYTRLFRS